jgi:hypothetical protein
MQTPIKAYIERWHHIPVTRNPVLKVTIYSLIALLFFLANPQSLNYDYGDQGGRYEDKIDSFSDYIIRNTVKINILSDNSEIFSIITKNYGDYDFNYYEDDYKKYYANMNLQTVALASVSKLLGLQSEQSINILIRIFRLTSAAALALLATSYMYLFCIKNNLSSFWLIPVLVSGNAGFVLYSQNIYFISWIMLLAPTALALTLLYRPSVKYAVVAICSMMFFLRGYEFATIFALLVALTGFLFENGEMRSRIKTAVFGFAITCLTFLIALALHVFLVRLDSGFSLSLSQAAEVAFSSVRTRTSSLEGVPAPYSMGLVHAMVQRWQYPAFGWIVGLPTFPKIQAIFALGLAGWLSYRWLRPNEIAIFAFGFLGYASWYVFAYQHVISHQGMYDYYVFAFSLGMAIPLLILIAADKIMRSLENRFAERPGV